MSSVVILAVVVLIVAFLCTSHSRPIRVPGNVEYVEIDLKDVEVRPVIENSETLFSEVIDKYHPYAAINGTYYGQSMRPLGDIFIEGELKNRGCYRNAVATTQSGKVVFLHKNKGRLNWSGCRSGLAAGPRLVHNGRVTLDPVADGFSRRSLVLKALRSGVGRTKSGKLLLVTTTDPMTLNRFAQTMLDLGAEEAMNLDGGGACGLYANGKTLATPMLPMTNMLLVFKNRRSN